MISPDKSEAAVSSLRDLLRSARNWRDLLSEDDRICLLRDIATVALAVGHDVYAAKAATEVDDLDIRASTEPKSDICPRERLAFLQKAIPRLLYILPRIEAAPVTRTVSGERSVRTEEARRISPTALLRSLRRGEMVPIPTESEGFSLSPSPLAARLGNQLPRFVDEAVTTPLFDTPANRMVKAILVIFARDLSAIAALAGAIPQTAETTDVIAQAERLMMRLRIPLRRTPWRNLHLPSPAQVPNLPIALHRNGTYALFHETYRMYRRGFCFDWSNPLFTLPPRDTWQLYEYWGLFQVVHVLQNLGFCTRHAEGFVLSRTGLRFRIAPRSTMHFYSESLACRITLTYQRIFTSSDTAQGETPSDTFWHSRSYTMQPDITLEVNGKLLIFDTKFKMYAEDEEIEPENTSRNNNGSERRIGNRSKAVLADIQQMHAYRDAIREGGKNPVKAAWILYAGRRDRQNAAVLPFPDDSTTIFGNGDVGAILLRPNNALHNLTEIIQAFLASTNENSG